MRRADREGPSVASARRASISTRRSSRAATALNRANSARRRSVELAVRVEVEAMHKGCGGYYQPRSRRIALSAAVSVNQRAAALVHELAHALVELDRHPEDPELTYAAEELVAESVAPSV